MKTPAELQGGPFDGEQIEVSGCPAYIYRALPVSIYPADSSPVAENPPVALYQYVGRFRPGAGNSLLVYQFVRVAGIR